ncbi:MAG TPA: S-methyl-5'-thioadenosine phosphorylase [Desulfobacteria bacterium]|nr:S-methyl-5'-thioadenosine phosphorylase [Desulfobacteria bacterium]
MGVSFAIIGGTGVYNPDLLDDVRQETVATPYGTVNVNVGRLIGKEVAFLARHGEKHSVPPHLVNYRANIWALKKLGVSKVIATAAVGSLDTEFGPGRFVLADQFLDFTKNRPNTFFTGEQGVVHIDVTDPYCGELRAALVKQAGDLGIDIHNGGVYVCTEGPRFETPAEIKMFRLLGGQLVGMTSVPEVVLAKEAGMCYATIAMVTNYAAGISPTPLTHQEVVENMSQMGDKLNKLIFSTLKNLGAERTCNCRQAIDELGKF